MNNRTLRRTIAGLLETVNDWDGDRYQSGVNLLSNEDDAPLGCVGVLEFSTRRERDEALRDLKRFMYDFALLILDDGDEQPTMADSSSPGA